MAKKSLKYTKPSISDSISRNVRKNDSFFTNPLFHKLLLFFGAIILYGWTYQFEYGIDDKFILNSINNTDTDFKGFTSIFSSWFAGADYRPISILSFWMEKIIFGVSGPDVSHAVNVFLFGCILVKIYDFIIVSRFFADYKKLKLFAFLCGILFLIHPNHVSIVANIKARDNLLSMLFGLFAAIQLILYFDSKRIYRIALFLLIITLAFLSKLDAYVFIFTPLMVIVLFRETDKKKLINTLAISMVLFLVAIIILSLFRDSLNKEEYIFSMGFDENPLVLHDTFISRLSLSLTSLFYYLKFLFVPTAYYFFYGYNQIPVTGLFSAINIFTLIVLFILSYLSIKIFSKNRIYLFSLMFFIFSIAYALNIVTLVAGIVMDKYNFIASLGFCLALAAFFIDSGHSASLKTAKKYLLFFLLITLTSFTIYRTKDWRNSFTLIEKDMPHLTQSANANRMAGAAYINLALAEELKPNNNRAYTDTLVNIGERYAIQGLTIYDKVPDLWELKGLSSFYRKDYPQALQYFLKSKEVDSTYLSSINYIGYTYWALNKTDSAYFYFKYVIDREPAFYYAANNMLNMLLQTNRRASADSLVTVLKKRFPEDKWLKQRIVEIYGNQ